MRSTALPVNDSNLEYMVLVALPTSSGIYKNLLEDYYFFDTDINTSSMLAIIFK